MLRTLLTKEIKVFHSPSQVGLAYMVAGILERKKRDIFSGGYFRGRGLDDPIISRKTTISAPPGSFPLCRFTLFVLKYPPIFISASYDWCLTCCVNHIANFAVSA
jgi:hypothetical protein